MSLDDDARSFGHHSKQGGWRLGLLVVRNVHVSDDERGRSDLVADSHGKVTANQFAEKAGVSARTVLLYYKAWQMAAKDGKCTPAEELSPGDEDPNINFEEDYDDMRDEWLTYYRKTKGPKAATPDEQSRPIASQRPTGTPHTPQARCKFAVKSILGIDLAAAEDLRELAHHLQEARKLICERIDQLLERIEAEPVSLDTGPSTAPGPDALDGDGGAPCVLKPDCRPCPI